MRLDYVDLNDEEREDNRIIRLYDFDSAEVELIRGQVIDLASGSSAVVPVHELPFVNPIDGCALFLRVSNEDYGIRPRGNGMGFDCDLTAATWEQVAWYMEPFLTAADPNHFQWLDDTFQWGTETSDVCFLFTPHPDGYW